jgi:hypothetical protein
MATTRQEACDWVKAKIQVYCDLKLKELNALNGKHPDILLELCKKGLEAEKQELLDANQAHFDMLDNLDKEIQRLQ